MNREFNFNPKITIKLILSKSWGYNNFKAIKYFKTLTWIVGNVQIGKTRAVHRKINITITLSIKKKKNRNETIYKSNL